MQLTSTVKVLKNNNEKNGSIIWIKDCVVETK